MDRKVENILMGVLFVVFVALVFFGQKMEVTATDYTGLIMELVGLFGLVGLLFMYNRRYK